MYTIRLDNCFCQPCVRMEFNFRKIDFCDVIRLATGAFRQVEVTDADTGELAYSRYVNSEHFVVDCDSKNFYDILKELDKYANYTEQGREGQPSSRPGAQSSCTNQHRATAKTLCILPY